MIRWNVTFHGNDSSFHLFEYYIPSIVQTSLNSPQSAIIILVLQIRKWSLREVK